MTAEDADSEFLRQEADGFTVRLQTRVYGVDAVAAAAHRFTDRCYVHIEHIGDEAVVCRVVPKTPGVDARAIAGEFANEVLDQRLRSKLATETDSVRRLLLAHAFSNTNILHPDLDTSDPAADPAGMSAPDRGGP